MFIFRAATVEDLPAISSGIASLHACQTALGHIQLGKESMYALWLSTLCGNQFLMAFLNLEFLVIYCCNYFPANQYLTIG